MESFAGATVRRAALLGLLALASATLLPYVHAIAGGCDHANPACDASDQRESAQVDGGGSTSHSRHCGVCGSFANGNGRVLSFTAIPALAAPLVGFIKAPFIPVVVLAAGDSDVAGARAPPASRRSA